MPKKPSPISPILAVDGILTVVAALVLSSSLATTTEPWRLVAALIWLGFAATHLVGWLAVVLKVPAVRNALSKVNALKLYDFQGFLYIYLALTVGILVLQLVHLSSS